MRCGRCSATCARWSCRRVSSPPPRTSAPSRTAAFRTTVWTLVSNAPPASSPTSCWVDPRHRRRTTRPRARSTTSSPSKSSFAETDLPGRRTSPGSWTHCQGHTTCGASITPRYMRRGLSSGGEAAGEEAFDAVAVAGDVYVGTRRPGALPQQLHEYAGRRLHGVVRRTARADHAGGGPAAQAAGRRLSRDGRAWRRLDQPRQAGVGGDHRDRLADVRRISAVVHPVHENGQRLVNPVGGQLGRQVLLLVAGDGEVDTVDERLVQLPTFPERDGAGAEGEVPAGPVRGGVAQDGVEVLGLPEVPVADPRGARRG